MDTDPDKLEAALSQLEAEKERRQQAKVDSGEAVLWSGVPIVISLCDEEDARASLPTTTSDGRPIYYDGDAVTAVVTCVPKKPEYSTPQVQQAASSRELSVPPEEPAGSGEVLSPSPPSQPTYVRITIRNGGEDDPGQIAEAWYTIEDGLLVLRDTDDKHITSRALLKGEDAGALARILLREAEAPKDFQAPIRYRKLGLA
jgi:hypothetical protein